MEVRILANSSEETATGLLVHPMPSGKRRTSREIIISRRKAHSEESRAQSLGHRQGKIPVLALTKATALHWQSHSTRRRISVFYPSGSYRPGCKFRVRDALGGSWLTIKFSTDGIPLQFRHRMVSCCRLSSMVSSVKYEALESQDLCAICCSDKTITTSRILKYLLRLAMQ